MALSRFWLFIVFGSIVFLFFQMTSGRLYSIDQVVNGKKDDALVKKEVYMADLPVAWQDSLLRSPDHRFSVPGSKGIMVLDNNTVKITSGKLATDGLLPTCKNLIIDLLVPLIAYLSFFCGILQLLIDSGASAKLAKLMGPFFSKVFPEIPADHPSISYMTLNFAANFLGLDSAATPFGLKAMESLQTLNPDKDKASNAQIMFLCLHAAGLTLIPTSIIGYRAAQNAHNPADVMLPCVITSFVGTIAALIIVGLRQRINLLDKTILLAVATVAGAIAGLLYYLNGLSTIGKNHLTANISNVVLLAIIAGVLLYSILHEKQFEAGGRNIFESFVEGAASGLDTGRRIFPYMLGMLVAISLFRNSGLFEIIAGNAMQLFTAIGVDKQVSDALPIAILRPFNASGSRGFMIDAMRTYGPDSFTGRLACIFQCAAETTFYVIAVYFGSIKVRNTRYTLASMLLTDMVCVFAAIGIAWVFFR